MSTNYERIFGPRVERAVKAIRLMKNGPAYKPDQAQVDATLGALRGAVASIEEIYGVEPAQPAAACIKEAPREGWLHHDIARNVASIPSNQLTMYLTQIVARACDAIETLDRE